MTTAQISLVTGTGRGGREPVTNASIQSDWQPLCTAPNVADNGGAAVVDPGAIVRAEQTWGAIQGEGTTLQVRLKYPAAAAISTDVVVQCFGRDRNGAPQRLFAGAVHELTLADAASDVTDGTSKWTEAVEVDCQANSQVIVAIKTALAGTGIAGALIEGRLK